MYQINILEYDGVMRDTKYKMLGLETMNVPILDTSINRGRLTLAYRKDFNDSENDLVVLFEDKTIRIVRPYEMLSTLDKEPDIKCVVASENFILLEIVTDVVGGSRNFIQGPNHDERVYVYSPHKPSYICKAIIGNAVLNVSRYITFGSLVVVSFLEQVPCSSLKLEQQVIIDKGTGSILFYNRSPNQYFTQMMIMTKQYLISIRDSYMQVIDKDGVRIYACEGIKDLVVDGKYIYSKISGFIIATERIEFKNYNKRRVIVDDGGIHKSKSLLHIIKIGIQKLGMAAGDMWMAMKDIWTVG
jgi:hypothetical protein